MSFRNRFQLLLSYLLPRNRRKPWPREDLKRLSATQAVLVRPLSSPILCFYFIFVFSSPIKRWHFKKRRMTSKSRWLHSNVLNKSLRRDSGRSCKGSSWPWMIRNFIRRVLLLFFKYHSSNARSDLHPQTSNQRLKDKDMHKFSQPNSLHTS